MFKLVVLGDTSTAGNQPGFGPYVFLSSAKLYEPGKSADLQVGPNSIFGVPSVTNPGYALFADASHGLDVNTAFSNPALATYDAVSNIGSLNIAFLPGYLPSITLKGGGVVDFAAITQGTFSASVPEPGAWTMLILGLGLAGAGLRRRRAPCAA